VPDSLTCPACGWIDKFPSGKVLGLHIRGDDACPGSGRSDLYWQGYHEAKQRLDGDDAPSRDELKRLVAVLDEWAMGYRDGLRGREVTAQ
jgi:hypothetical protein